MEFIFELDTFLSMH